jgi:hypothetical protein
MNSIAWDKRNKQHVNREAFQGFWHDYRKKQIEAGREDWEDIPSPYDI